MSTSRPPKWLFVVLVFLCSSIWQVHADAGFLVVTIERVKALDGFEGIPGGDADFYAIVTIDGTPKDNSNDYVLDDDDISPNWQFSKAVDLSQSSIHVIREIQDSDGGARGDDDVVDIVPVRGTRLHLDVSPSPCLVSGARISGNCGQSLVSRGNGGGDGDAEIHFRIEIKDSSSLPPLPWDVIPADPATTSDPFDPNHLLFNPRWGWQTQPVSTPPKFDDCIFLTDCTRQFPKNDFPDWSIPFVCHSSVIGRGGQGHTNWEVVTYKGQIQWSGHEIGIISDDDYNLQLHTPFTNGFASGGTAGRMQLPLDYLVWIASTRIRLPKYIQFMLSLFTT